MAFSFQNWLFAKLPLYFKLNDTYKDVDDRGLLERYLEIFGLELDNNLKPQIDNYLDIIDPFTTDPKFLTDLGYTLGSPPDLLGDPDNYAKLLAYIISVYKIKGTARAYQLLFSLLGFNVSIIEYDPSATLLMDEGNIMDDGGIMDNGCPCCSDYEVIVNQLLNPDNNAGCINPSQGTVDQTILPTFIKIIEFNQPINAHLLGIVSGGQVCEAVDYCIQESIIIDTISVAAMDNSLIMDSGRKMDESIITSSTPISQDCSGPLEGGIGFMQIENDFIVS